MRGDVLKGKRGSSAIEKVVIIIILVAFAVIAFVIVASVFHFALPSLGGAGTGLGNAPARCTFSWTAYTTASGCHYNVTAADGTPGIVYNVYNSTAGRMGSYVAGSSEFNADVFISNGGRETYYCNTTGYNGSGGVRYTAGGLDAVPLSC